jgi:putative cardiolipin synthase
MSVAPVRAYKLRLNDRGKIEWVTQIDGEEVVFTKEPDSTWWQRFKVGFYRMLPIKDQL